MSQRCPVCKTRLWQGAFLRVLKCPRCGAQFRPTVSWAYFQLLLLLFVLLSLSVLIIFLGHNLWLVLLFLVFMAVFFWFLPKLIDLKPVSQDFGMVGPVTNEELQLELRYSGWEEPEAKEPLRFSPLYYFCIVLLLGLFALILLRLLH